MKMRSYNFCHTNTKNPGNNLGIFCLITGRPKLNGYCFFTFVPTLYKNAKVMAHEKANPFAFLIVPNGSVYSLLLDIDLCRRTR